MKIISWNVNGIRAAMQKGLGDFLKKEDADIVCIQETKIDHAKTFPIDGYPFVFWNCAHKKGYSGTAIFSRSKPFQVYYGLGLKHTDEEDDEGRILVGEFEKFFLLNVYTPNAQRGLMRLQHRMNWDKKFFTLLCDLEKKKPVVFCGDLNVAHKEIDIAHPEANRHNPGFTDEERRDFDTYIQHGFIDTFREFHKEPRQYTWWSYMFHARQKNIGWRIDYFCISATLKSRLKDAFILPHIMGSDHCPIGIVLKE